MNSIKKLAIVVNSIIAADKKIKMINVLNNMSVLELKKLKDKVKIEYDR